MKYLQPPLYLSMAFFTSFFFFIAQCDVVLPLKTPQYHLSNTLNQSSFIYTLLLEWEIWGGRLGMIKK